MEKSSNHLCELLSPCCLDKISKSVVIEILKVFINILFLSMIIEFVSLFIFSIINYFYPSITCREIGEENIPQAKEVLNKPEKSVLSGLFKTSDMLPSYNFNFNT